MWVGEEGEKELLLCPSAAAPNPTVFSRALKCRQVRYLSTRQCLPALLRLARVAWVLFFLVPSQSQFHFHVDFP